MLNKSSSTYATISLRQCSTQKFKSSYLDTEEKCAKNVRNRKNMPKNPKLEFSYTYIHTYIIHKRGSFGLRNTRVLNDI